MGYGSETLVLTQTTAQGNSSTVERSIFVSVPSIDPVTSDNVINQAERSNGITLSGDNGPNATVQLRIGNLSLDAQVSGTRWTRTLTSAQISSLGEGALTVALTQSIAG